MSSIPSSSSNPNGSIGGFTVEQLKSINTLSNYSFEKYQRQPDVLKAEKYQTIFVITIIALGIITAFIMIPFFPITRVGALVIPATLMIATAFLMYYGSSQAKYLAERGVSLV